VTRVGSLGERDATALLACGLSCRWSTRWPA